ncbi:MAG: hypothetical protein B5M51_02780 [Anaerolinea sp. 4484_236]|nr:MAG: hypothetical protein B5M51_02780 [Anaerolinea sp. 4484_236]
MKKKTILVTGGAGHVGSHVIEALVTNRNNNVISLDNYFNGREENHLPGADYRKGDTKDIDSLITETPDIIYHLGEYARIAPSFDDVEKVFDMNAVGTFAVLEFCRKHNVPKLVYSASSTKFTTGEGSKDKNPYSFFKSNNVDLINNYGNWYGLPYAICYFYNGFGPRENGNGKYATLIAKFEQAYLRGDPLTVVKPGTQKRAFTYVKDLARGIILAGENGWGDGYAFGVSETYSVYEIAKAFGGQVELIDGYPGRLNSPGVSPKARDELGWHPTVDVIDYIQKFVENHPRT